MHQVCFPIRIFPQLSLSKNFEDIRSTPLLFHHEPSETPDCTIKAEDSFFDSADGSLNYSICLGSTWGGCVMRSTNSVASSKNLDYCLFGLFLDFRSGRRNRCRRTMVPCFGIRLGKDNMWIRFVTKPCTTTAYLHCHLDILSSVRMLWSAEMTSAKTIAAKCTVISGIKLDVCTLL